MTLPARLGLICGLAATPLLLTPAAAEEGMFFKDMLGTIGIIPKSKEPIAYRDRAPLVVPPKTELRTPGTRTGAAANAAWPNDPDVAARRRAAAEAAEPVTQSEKRRMSGDNNVRLTPQELQAGRVASSAAPIPGTHRGDSARDVLYLTPDQLRAGAKRDDDEAVPVGGEPARRALTDPPTGMRKSAGSRPVRADFVPKVDTTRSEADPMTWLTRGFRKDDDE